MRCSRRSRERAGPTVVAFHRWSGAAPGHTVRPGVWRRGAGGVGPSARAKDEPAARRPSTRWPARRPDRVPACFAPLKGPITSKARAAEPGHSDSPGRLDRRPHGRILPEASARLNGSDSESRTAIATTCQRPAAGRQASADQRPTRETETAIVRRRPNGLEPSIFEGDVVGVTAKAVWSSSSSPKGADPRPSRF